LKYLSPTWGLPIRNSLPQKDSPCNWVKARVQSIIDRNSTNPKVFSPDSHDARIGFSRVIPTSLHANSKYSVSNASVIPIEIGKLPT
jgi:hypothetical protein